MENVQVAPREGMALLHIHGDKCMLHEARNVTKGIKYILRSDVAFAWSTTNPDARFWDRIYVLPPIYGSKRTKVKLSIHYKITLHCYGYVYSLISEILEFRNM